MSHAKDASLEDRVVIVTGGVRGLGREMALELASLGAKVVVTGASESEAMRETIGMANAVTAEGRVLGIAADVSNFAACESVLKFTLEKFKGLDALGNEQWLRVNHISCITSL